MYLKLLVPVLGLASLPDHRLILFVFAVAVAVVFAFAPHGFRRATVSNRKQKNARVSPWHCHTTPKTPKGRANSAYAWSA
jgi:diadenosine tetraphosphate (Ap4A) HIT family hydrolase